jgi:hypothetical protein
MRRTRLWADTTVSVWTISFQGTSKSAVPVFLSSY